MKKLYFIFLLFISLTSAAQVEPIMGTIIKHDSLLSYANIKIYLFHEDRLVIETLPDSVGKFTLSNLSPGLYSLTVHAKNYPKSVLDSFMVYQEQSSRFVNIHYPFLCRNKPYTIICGAYNQDHTNHIVPIIYGIPSKKNKRKSRKGKVFLGGESDSDCDLKYYCTIHKLRM